MVVNISHLLDYRLQCRFFVSVNLMKPDEYAKFELLYNVTVTRNIAPLIAIAKQNLRLDYSQILISNLKLPISAGLPTERFRNTSNSFRINDLLRMHFFSLVMG